MEKKTVRIFAFILLFALALGVFSGCFFFEFNDYDADDGYDDPDDYEEQEYVFDVECTDDKTVITLNDVGYYGDTATLVYLKPYEYLESERQTGIVEERTSSPEIVGSYDCGTQASFTIDRYTEEGYDTVYCKFYLTRGSTVVAGPVYATTIKPAYEHDEVVQATGIKGLMLDFPYEDEVEKLGCEHIQLNYLASDMIVPLETYDEQTKEITPIAYTEYLDGDLNGYIENPETGRQYVQAFDHNGKRYYFRTQAWTYNGRGHGHVLSYYDRLISQYTRQHVKITLIILMWMELEQYVEPYFLTYPESRTSGATYFAVNTSNSYGAEYWSAFTKFIAMRYSQEDSYENAKYGTAETFIMGNEIDQSSSWNAIVADSDSSLDISNYCTEYERMLRISNQSFKSAYSRNVPLVPLTHFWTAKGTPDILKNQDYKPKEIFDYLSLKTKTEGNYNWGLAIHPYGADLVVTDFWRNDVTKVNGSLNTEKITWTNLEVLQLYLEQPVKLCNGNVRDVYVTEGGVTSGSNYSTQYSVGKNQQAAGVAYAYYKATQLSCIKALNYWRLCDHNSEGAYFGLMTESGAYKPAYYVWKYIDTQYSYLVSAEYFSYIQWTENIGGSVQYFGAGHGATQWSEVMAIRPSNFNWEERWDESKIAVRYVDEYPDFL
ncbi:MAG: DUF5722 domain-containing protein [Corallococcus sp.]|nr:DUF5722 domain-containing protein [Corallococcus sp.]